MRKKYRTKREIIEFLKAHKQKHFQKLAKKWNISTQSVTALRSYYKRLHPELLNHYTLGRNKIFKYQRNPTTTFTIGTSLS